MNETPMREATRRHAVIAGTGRAGTTFLVEFLGACGLDVGAALEDDRRFERARAGRETALDSSDNNLPYVVKDPWLFTYCQSMDLTKTGIDALIIPIRDIWDAAASRIHQERLSMIDAGWGKREDVVAFGKTPGGILHSLEPLDQAHVLALGFHTLVEWAVENEIPTYLLAFPRIVRDGDYLVRALSPWLLERCDAQSALRAFSMTARPGAVRERAGNDSDTRRERLAHEAKALREKLAEVQVSLDEAHEREAHARDVLTVWDGQIKDLTAVVEHQGARVAELEAQLAAEAEARTEAKEHRQFRFGPRH